VKFLLDSDIISYLARGDETTLRNFQLHKTDDRWISSITAAEQYFGLEHPGFDERRGVRIMQMMELLHPAPLDERAGRQAGIVRQFLLNSGRSASVMDTLLAGHALALGATLVTNNTRDFEGIPGLRIENWSK
jgi:tRNA(fMet)-specific endonuclease VapC